MHCSQAQAGPVPATTKDKAAGTTTRAVPPPPGGSLPVAVSSSNRFEHVSQQDDLYFFKSSKPLLAFAKQLGRMTGIHGPRTCSPLTWSFKNCPGPLELLSSIFPSLMICIPRRTPRSHVFAWAFPASSHPCALPGAAGTEVHGPGTQPRGGLQQHPHQHSPTPGLRCRPWYRRWVRPGCSIFRETISLRAWCLNLQRHEASSLFQEEGDFQQGILNEVLMLAF